jgi:hypothetical protein
MNFKDRIDSCISCPIDYMKCSCILTCTFENCNCLNCNIDNPKCKSRIGNKRLEVNE